MPGGDLLDVCNKLLTQIMFLAFAIDRVTWTLCE